MQTVAIRASMWVARFRRSLGPHRNAGRRDGPNPFLGRLSTRLASLVLAWLGVSGLVLGVGAPPCAADGEEYVVRPWLTETFYELGASSSTVQVSLYYQIENLTANPVTFRGIIDWTVRSEDLDNPFTRSGTMDHSGQYVWAHGSTVAGISPDTRQPYPPTQIEVPVGRYSYGLVVKDRDTGNIVLGSSLSFEVRVAACASGGGSGGGSEIGRASCRERV